MKLTTLNSLEQDTLKEIANIGAGNASNALSQMISKPVLVTIPELKLVPIERVPDMMGQAEQVFTVVVLKISGDAPGTMFLLFNPTDAIVIAELVTQRKNVEGKLSEEDKEAIKEIGNVISGAALASLSSFLGLHLLQSIPYSTTDMIRASVDVIIAELGEKTDSALLLEVGFNLNESSVKGILYFLFDPVSTEKILTATRAKMMNQ
jgi:chemotaxis protein CheC